VAYELWYSDEFKRDAKRLDRPMQERLKKVIAKVWENPERFKHLEHGVPRFRVRFGAYRLLYGVVGNRVELMRVGKRDVVYD
jgi:mRNA-degrading endonuclease RelE of RelBE toxin-antitoxin system